MGCRRFGLQMCALAALVAALAGCAPHAIDRQIAMAEFADIPRELDKMSFPAYRVEPPDILLIEAINNIRPAHAPLEAGDTVTMRLQNGLTIVIPPELDPVEDQLEYQ